MADTQRNRAARKSSVIPLVKIAHVAWFLDTKHLPEPFSSAFENINNSPWGMLNTV